MSADRETRMPRWGKIVLIVSLGLNLAVLGLVAGIVLRGPVVGLLPLVFSVDGMRRIHLAMPEEERDGMREDLRLLRDETRSRRDAMRTSRQGILNALRAEPYSEEALISAMEDQHDHLRDLAARLRELMVSRISNMSSESRAEFADNLEAAYRRQRPGNKPPRRPNDD